MRHLFYILTVCVVLIACSGVTPEWQAASAAKEYYDCLAEGYAEGYLEGKANIDSLPEDYGEQLLGSVKQYQVDMQAKHQGLRQVLISDNVGFQDTIQHVIYAYLLLCYGDSTQEEVTVPMVEHNGKWLMK